MDNFEKSILDSDLGGSKELSPGTVRRRFEQDGGPKRHRERIHKENSNSNLNLPFEFSKPKKAGRREIKRCYECGEVIYTSINTVGFICKSCGKYVQVERLIVNDR